MAANRVNTQSRQGAQGLQPGPEPGSLVRLTWPNEHRRLVAEVNGGYRWSDSLAEHHSRTLAERGRFGQETAARRNLLITGDALDALAALGSTKPYSKRISQKIALCYIDPPFNRGDDFGYYDDTLGRDVWLSMLRDRLTQVAGLLAPDGSVWVHLDDAEQHRGRCVLDEVFGEDAFVATVIWQKRTSRDNRKAFSSMHDYIHVYAPAGALAWKKRRNPLPDKGAFSNPDHDPRGPWRSIPMTAPAGHATASQFYTLVSPAGVHHDPPAGRCWTYTRERFEELVAAGRVYWPRSGRGKPRLKRYPHEVTGLAPFTIWTSDEVGENADAKKDLLTLFPDQPPFETPKPERLLERILHIGSRPGEYVLDCFLGSGTTAAVAHKMGRAWVGIERSAETVGEVTLPRLQRVVEGNDGIGVTPLLGWTGGGGFSILDVSSSGS